MIGSIVLDVYEIFHRVTNVTSTVAFLVCKQSEPGIEIAY